ncbi:MAG TPA: acetate--CoA ligase family protein [Candidatus Brocadiia bacterium]|nr:acetate--CoA ligase family protein [Candidatus Brocadiia bacterium]
MSLESFFSPKSVSVVGASRHKGKVGHEILASLLAGGYPGEVFPVNPKVEEVLGLKCYPDLVSIGKPPELVVIVVPAEFVEAVIRECGKVGSKSVVIITAGFKETGERGRALEEAVVKAARANGIKIIGPNCLGVMSPGDKLNASFGGDLPRVGGIAYLSQSGALMTAILDMAAARDIGFSLLLSIGNKADVDELEIIKALGQRPGTKVIAGYLESIQDGDAFVRQAEIISQNKPILLMKSGGTGAGARAASSHTGSLAGSETAYEVIFDRAGIIRCDSIKTQFDYAQAFADQPIPKGPNVAVLTNAGGPGIMTADAIERSGLTFAALTDETKSALSKVLPPAANIHNPVDVLGDALADRYEAAMNIVLDDPNVHSVVVLLTPQAMTQCSETARIVVKVAGAKPGKTVLACFMGGRKVEEAIHILRRGAIPQYDSPESAVATLKAMQQYTRWLARPERVVRLFPVNRRKVEQIIGRHLRRGEREIGEMASKEILEAYGFVTPKGSLATTAEQAAAIADQLGYPVVLKIWSPDIIHKSDVGGVKVGINSAKQVMDAFDLMMYRIPKKMPNAEIMGVLVQEMCSAGKEVILGMHRDPRFGPLLMFGMGGITVEVLKDVAFYLAPITASEAKEMLIRTKTYSLLKGVRGDPGVDIDAVAEGLQRLSQLVTEFPEIKEMDINPFIVGPQGSTPIAVDARISVEKTD